MQTARDDQQNPKTVEYVLTDAEKTLKDGLTHLIVDTYKWCNKRHLKRLTSIAFKLSREVLSERTLVESNSVLKSVDETTIRLLSFFLIIDFCEDIPVLQQDFYNIIRDPVLLSPTIIGYEAFIELRDEFTILIIKHWAWDHLSSTMHRCSFRKRSSTSLSDTSASPETDTSECLAVIKETDSGSDLYVSGDDEPGDTPPLMYFDGEGFFTPKFAPNKGLTTPTTEQKRSILFSP